MVDMDFNRDIFFRFFKGELSAEECSGLMAWAKESEDNYATLENERKMFDLLNLAPDECFEESKVRRFPLLWKVVGAAASVVLLVAASLFIIKPGRNNDIMVAETVVSAPSGARSLVKLPDGSEVWINSGTTLAYSTMPSKDGRREVTVEGQARFDVAKDEEHPFIVHTYFADLEVLGTSFDVIADKEREIFETALFTGSVSISTPGSKEPLCILTPDQKVFRSGRKLSLGSIENYEVYNWIDGLYCFRDRTFSQIVDDLKLYFGTEIDFNVKPELASEKLTGKFRVNDGLDSALKVLQISLDFKYAFNDDNQSVTITDK